MTNPDTNQPPIHMGERVSPPKSVEWEVSEKAGMVEFRLVRNDRTVCDKVLLEPNDAEELAGKLTTEAERVRKFQESYSSK